MKVSIKSQSTHNPYQKAIIDYLKLHPMADNQTFLDQKSYQFLSNMIQGMFIQYLVKILADSYQVKEPFLFNRLIFVITKILTDSFFSTFKAKIELDSSMLLELVKLISQEEVTLKNSESLFQEMVKDFTRFHSIGRFVKWLLSHPEFESISFLSQVQERIYHTQSISSLSV